MRRTVLGSTARSWNTAPPAGTGYRTMLPDYRVRQRDELLEINRLITEELDLGVVLARILRVATQLLSSHAGLVALHEDSSSSEPGTGGGWRIAASHGIRNKFLHE